MAPKISVHAPEIDVERASQRIPMTVLLEDMAIVLDSLGVDPGIRELMIMRISQDEGSGGLRVELLGPRLHAQDVLVELIDEGAPPGARTQMSLFYPDEFMATFCQTSEFPTVTDDHGVVWRPGWQSTAPDIFIRLGAGPDVDHVQVEQALLALGADWGSIHFLQVQRLDASTLLVHADGVSAEDQVEALELACRTDGRRTCDVDL